MSINEEWVSRNVDTDPIGQAEILKIALCPKYQKDYSTIETLCERAGLGAKRADIIKDWLYRKGFYQYEESILYEYIKNNEPERYNKALYLYYKKNSNSRIYF